MNIVSGPARVVDTGMVTAFMGNAIRLELDGASVVEILFETTDDGAVRADTEWTDQGIRFVLFNFDGDEGRGSKDPALLGEWGEDLLFFHFRVFRWGSTSDRTVQYTFYLVAKEHVHWKPGAEEGSQG